MGEAHAAENKNRLGLVSASPRSRSPQHRQRPPPRRAFGPFQLRWRRLLRFVLHRLANYRETERRIGRQALPPVSQDVLPNEVADVLGAIAVMARPPPLD